MNYRILLALACFTLSIAACKPSKPSGGQEEAASLLGAWEAKEISVLKDWGTGAEEQVVVPSRADRKPVVTIFEPKGTFTEQTWASNDSLIQSKLGFWHQHEDSLFLNYADEGAKRNSYGISFKSRELKLEMAVDFDMDGKRDDRIQVTMTRQ